MTASKEITYLNVNVFASYLIELSKLASQHAPRLGKRGVIEATIHELRQTGDGLQEAVTTHLTAMGTKDAESADQRAARADTNEWMMTIKHGAKTAFRDDPKLFAVARHHLRIGVNYNPRRAASVLAEAIAMLPGVQKHRAKLLTRLTPEEVDAGQALIDALSAKLGSRTTALNEQLGKKFERTQLFDRGMTLAKQVLDGVELEFKGKDEEPLRDLFFGLDERMATAARSGGAGDRGGNSGSN